MKYLKQKVVIKVISYVGLLLLLIAVGLTADALGHADQISNGVYSRKIEGYGY